jgi:sarcosine/dimethylglycine N-methyltransferase
VHRFAEAILTDGDDPLRAHVLERARAAAHAPGEFAGQESFMRLDEIRTLAERAGIGGGTRVLDLCCGIAGPGRFITRALGCSYLGVDASGYAIEIARERAGGLPCEFRVARVPPVPAGPFDAVLLLETMLAFADAPRLLDGVSAALVAGGRFGCTLEAGEPLTPAERSIMPGGDTVTLRTEESMRAGLEAAGMAVRWRLDVTASHGDTAAALLAAYEADAAAIGRAIGDRATDRLLTAHRVWVEWLGSGRVRKLLLVAERAPA